MPDEISLVDHDRRITVMETTLPPMSKKVDKIYDILKGEDGEEGVVDIIRRHEDQINTSIERRKSTRKLIRERVAWITGALVFMAIQTAIKLI